MRSLLLKLNLSFLAILLVSCGDENDSIENMPAATNTQIDEEHIDKKDQEEYKFFENNAEKETEDEKETQKENKGDDQSSESEEIVSLMSQAQKLYGNAKDFAFDNPAKMASAGSGLATAVGAKLYGASLLGAGGLATVAVPTLVGLVTFYATDEEGFNEFLAAIKANGKKLMNHISENPAEYSSAGSSVLLAGIAKYFGASFVGIAGASGLVPLIAGLSYLYVYDNDKFESLVNTIKTYGNVVVEKITSNPELTSPVSGVVTGVIAKYLGASIMGSAIMGLGTATVAGLGILYVYDKEKFDTLKEQSLDFFDYVKNQGTQIASEYPTQTGSASLGLGAGAIAKLLGASTLTTLGVGGLGAIVGFGLAYLYAYDKDNFDYLVDTLEGFKDGAFEFVSNHPRASAGTGITLILSSLFMYIKYIR